MTSQTEENLRNQAITGAILIVCGIVIFFSDYFIGEANIPTPTLSESIREIIGTVLFFLAGFYFLYKKEFIKGMGFLAVFTMMFLLFFYPLNIFERYIITGLSIIITIYLLSDLENNAYQDMSRSIEKSKEEATYLMYGYILIIFGIIFLILIFLGIEEQHIVEFIEKLTGNVSHIIKMFIAVMSVGVGSWLIVSAFLHARLKIKSCFIYL
jgi:uncharacterized membrane protein YidH (DUF202 family)